MFPSQRIPSATALSLPLLLAMAACDHSGGVTEADDSADTGAFEDPYPEDPYIQTDVWVTPRDPEPGSSATIHYQGEYADRDSWAVEYGFDGWTEVSDLEELEEREQGKDTYYLVSREMNPVSGGYEADIEIPEEVRVLHFRFYDPTTEGEEELVVDDNGGLDYHQSIDVFPYIGPYLTWNEQAGADGHVVVSFETSTTCLGTVEYGRTSDLGQRVMGEEADTLHHIPLTDLEPGTTYYYRVMDSLANTSEIATFTTAEQDPTEFSFGVISDMQDDATDKRWADVADELVANHPDIAFYVLPGDMPHNDEPCWWWVFFDKGRELFAQKVFMPVPGNHDTPSGETSEDTTSFERWFALPEDSGSETYYRFDYGGLTFFGLNSEWVDDFQPNGGQYAWFQEQVDALWESGALERDRVFVYWHVPPYNAGTRHAKEQDSTRPVTELFDGTVDWVFCGHEHLYQRMVPIQFDAVKAPSGEYGIGPMDGVGYLVTPPAGQTPSNRLVDEMSHQWYIREYVAFPEIDEVQTATDTETGFIRVDVEGRALSLEIWGMGTNEQPDDPAVRETYVDED